MTWPQPSDTFVWLDDVQIEHSQSRDCSGGDRPDDWGTSSAVVPYFSRAFFSIIEMTPLKTKVRETYSRDD